MKSTIRKADMKDRDAIHDIIGHYARKGVILERSPEEIAEGIDTFFVAMAGHRIAGIVSYHDYETQLAEIRSLAVLEEWHGRDIGGELVRFLVKHLLDEEQRKIFVLTYVPAFFRKQGFVEVPRESLPEKIWKDCSNCKDRDHCEEIALVYAPGKRS